MIDTRVFRGGDLGSHHPLVIVTLSLKLERKLNWRRRKECEAVLLRKTERRMEYVETLRKFNDNRRQQGNVEERWTQLKEALVGSAEQHL